MRFIDLAGQRFGRLVVLKEGPVSVAPSGARSVRWVCLCDCGTETLVHGHHLRKYGDNQSCGCLARELSAVRMKAQSTTHGMYKSTTYKVWQDMRTRCKNPSHASYEHYGAKGIKVCLRWEKFENFLTDMGERPEGMSLDREDNCGDYEPGNCKWATRAEQARNRSNNVNVTANGKTQCLADWAKELDVKYDTLRYRLKVGKWP